MLNKCMPANGEALPQKPDDSAVASAMRALEAQVSDLASMSKILADLLNEVLCDDKRDGIIRVSEYDMDKISFAWVDVASRANALKSAFYSAYKGESPQ